MTASIIGSSVFPGWNAGKPAFISNWHIGKNYNARNYDQMTGRFMQTDPVLTERSGYDAHDAYSYVAGNPVNFMDLSGATMCSKNWVAAGAVMAGVAATVASGSLLGFAAGMTGAAAVGVTGNYTGGGGDCSYRMPDKFLPLLLVLVPLLGQVNPALLYIAVSHYYENYMKGHGPSFLGRMNKSELQFSMLAYQQFLQNDGNAANDSYAILAYTLMAQYVSNPRFDIDQGSFYHDQFGPDVLDPKNRTATSRWIKHANRVAFSHDSWSRTYAREKNATPKWWGDARGGVATINTTATVLGNISMAATGTVLFGVANAITGTKNLFKPRKWRL